MPKPERSCFFTGHRFLSHEIRPDLSSRTETACITLIREHGVRDFIAGGALGFDTLAALVVLRLREQHPDIRLNLYLPCTDQTKHWNKKDIGVWTDIYNRADEYRYITDGAYIPGCMQLRNRAMVNDAFFCIAYCRRNTGGTFYTVNYALKKNRQIIML